MKDPITPDRSPDEPAERDCAALPPKWRMWLLWIKNVLILGKRDWREIGKAIDRKSPAVVRRKWY